MKLGKYHIDLENLIFIAVVIVATFIIMRATRFFMRRYLRKSTKFLKVDPTKYNFMQNALSFIIWSIAIFIIIYSIPELRALSLTLFAGAGILAAIFGFASQQAFSNIISGVFIVVFKPFRVGDSVNIGQLYTGEIEDITMRHTVIRDYENQRIIIPNSVISNQTVINKDIEDSIMLKHVYFGISYDSSIDKAMEIIRDETVKHPLFLDSRTEEDKKNGKHPVTIRVMNWDESAVNMRAYISAANFDNAFAMSKDLMKSVKERFDKEGVEIPYPHRTVVFKDKYGRFNQKAE